MGRYCTVCRDPNVADINAAILAGESYRDIAARHRYSAATLCRHKDHIPAALVKAHEAREVARADDLLQQAQDLLASALHILRKAENRGDDRTALLANREAAGRLELLARVMTAAMTAEREREQWERERMGGLTEDELDKDIERLINELVEQRDSERKAQA